MMRRFLLWAVDQYQRAAEGRPSPCRFFPSCSEYARESLTVHGAGRGSWLTARRLVRCRPFGPSGFDPVPEPAHGDTRHHSRHATHTGPCAHDHPGGSSAPRRTDASGPFPMKVS
jgi:uncharacterized protein